MFGQVTAASRLAAHPCVIMHQSFPEVISNFRQWSRNAKCYWVLAWLGYHSGDVFAVLRVGMVCILCCYGTILGIKEES